jgi:tRNA(adenine34) deaminase
MTQDQIYMSLALLQAQKALLSGEVPVGAVMVGPKGLMMAGHNQVESTNKVFAHAEIVVIEQACSLLHDKYLPDYTLYVTLEPCSLCMNAILMSKIKRVCFAAKSPRWGFSVDPLNIFEVYRTSLILSENVFASEAENLLQNFFCLRRN